MASTHKSLRSGTANKRPTTSIADGQIALNTNTTSPGLFFKDSTGATIIKVGPVHVGTTAPNASPAAGGSSGNSTGEVWLDTSLTPNGVKIWNGASWTNATPIGSTTVQGLLELATNAETQTGTDPDRAVTPAGLQSKVSDSTSTTSSTTIASSTAVKSAYDLANAALPKSGGTVTGNLEIGTTGSLSFEGATADAFETTIAVVDPTADRTITLPDTTGTVVTTGDTGTVTSTMIADGTIVDADISATAEIAVSKLADGTARQLLQTDAAGTGVEWASNIDVPGTLDVTSTATFDSIASHPLGSAAAPTITFTGDTNTGIYSPGADQVAISTNGAGRLFINSSGNIGVNTASPGAQLHLVGTSANNYIRTDNSSGSRLFLGNESGESVFYAQDGSQNAIPLVFKLGITERMRLTSSGLGVGTSTPGALLELSSSSTPQLFISNTSNSISSGGTIGTIDYRAGSSNTVVARMGATADSANEDGAHIVFENRTGGGAFSEKVRITSAGLVGIGTSSPGSILHCANAGTLQATIQNTAASLTTFLSGGSSAGGVGTSTNHPFDFFTNNQFRARIDSSGRLLVGTSSAETASLGALSQIQATGSSASALIKRNDNGALPSYLYLSKSRGTTVNSTTIVQDGDNLGAIRFTGADGSTEVGSIAAQITAAVDGTPGANDMPGRLVFSTTADGASSPTERMRIGQNGSVQIGRTTGQIDTELFTVQNGGQCVWIYQTANSNVVALTMRHTYALSAQTAKMISFLQNNGAEVGAITSTTTATAYGTSSDYRLKENVIEVTDGIARLQQLKPSRFNFIADPDKTVDGFIAHEVQAIVPEAIIGEKDAVDDEGNPVYQGIDQSKLVPLLTAALQEAIGEIESLKARLTAAGI